MPGDAVYYASLTDDQCVGISACYGGQFESSDPVCTQECHLRDRCIRRMGAHGLPLLDTMAGRQLTDAEAAAKAGTTEASVAFVRAVASGKVDLAALPAPARPPDEPDDVAAEKAFDAHSAQEGMIMSGKKAPPKKAAKKSVPKKAQPKKAPAKKGQDEEEAGAQEFQREFQRVGTYASTLRHGQVLEKTYQRRGGKVVSVKVTVDHKGQCYRCQGHPSGETTFRTLYALVHSVVSPYAPTASCSVRTFFDR